MAILSITHALAIAAGYVVWLIASQIVRYRFFHPLAKYPGPFLASVTRLWITWNVVRETEAEVFRQLCEKHG
jgi:hypothetical protein